MIFCSLEFSIFFIFFFVLYWLVLNNNLRLQNLLVLIGSYIFYAWWDWRFLSLLIGSSILNYYIGIYLSKSEDDKKRKFFFILGLIQGIGWLILFKYFNFFIDSIIDAFLMFGINVNIHTINLILPLGISFYTFRTLSYLIDINSGKIKPTNDWVVFFSYVAFFPSLISGPIDKAGSLIPQLEKKRIFDYNQVSNGARQILWGFLKKAVIANNLVSTTDFIFKEYQTVSGSTLVVGAFLYTIQIYADFSGYSDMAIGFSRMIGFNSTKNFASPLFSKNIAEFWKKWHISLTTWLTEYVFTPLAIAFRDFGKAGLVVAIIINFTVIGIWHGANWTFILFGFLHGCYFIPLILTGTLNKVEKKSSKNKAKPFLSIKNSFSIFITFLLVMFTFVIFRADTVEQSIQYLTRTFTVSLFTVPEILPKVNLLLCILFLTIEWYGKEQEYAFAVFGQYKSKIIRWAIYYIAISVIFYFGGQDSQFIYFQF